MKKKSLKLWLFSLKDPRVETVQLTHAPLSAHAKLAPELVPWVALDVIGIEYFRRFTVQDEIILQEQYFPAEVCTL